MNILVVNTCNKVLQVALKKEDKEFLYNYQSSKHNECLLDLIEKILTDSNLTLNNIDCIGVVVGIFLDNVPICMTFGIAIGMTVGMGVGSLIKKDNHKSK